MIMRLKIFCGNTAITIAADIGYVEIAELLIKQEGIDANARNIDLF